MDAKIQIAHLNQQLNWSLSFLWLTSYLFGCIIWTKYFYIVLNCLIWVKAIMRILHDVVLQIITNRFNYSKFLYFSNGLKWYYKAFVQQCSKSIKKWMAARKQGSSLSWRKTSLDRAKENMAKLMTTLTSIFQKSFPGFLVYRKCCNLSEDKKDKLPSNSTSLHFRPDLISKLSNSANIEARERRAMLVPRCPLWWTMIF